MATLSLKISIVEQGVTKTMQFEPATTVYDACRIIREKITEANLGQREYSHTQTLAFQIWSWTDFSFWHL